MYTYTCTRTHTHLYMHMYTYTLTHAHVHMQTYTCTRTHAHLYMHTYIYTHMHTYTCRSDTRVLHGSFSLSLFPLRTSRSQTTSHLQVNICLGYKSSSQEAKPAPGSLRAAVLCLASEVLKGMWSLPGGVHLLPARVQASCVSYPS